jgi:hypothetical protein
MPGDQEDWVLEVEGVVQVVVVDNDRRTEYDPNGDDHGRRELGLCGLWGRCGRRGWQRRISGCILIGVKDGLWLKEVLCDLLLLVLEITHGM